MNLTNKRLLKSLSLNLFKFLPLNAAGIFLFIFLFSAASYCQIDIEKFDGGRLKQFLAVSNIESDFLIKRQSKIADKPIVSKGKFFFQKPDKLRWEYSSPSESGFLIDGNSTLFWKTNKDKTKVKDISRNDRAKEMSDIILMFISMNTAEMEKIYTLELSGLELKLYPKDDSLKTSIKNITIILDDKKIAVKEVIILSQKDLKTSISFLNTKINQKIPSNVFKL